MVKYKYKCWSACTPVPVPVPKYLGKWKWILNTICMCINAVYLILVQQYNNAIHNYNLKVWSDAAMKKSTTWMERNKNALFRRNISTNC